jgi:hypothetical protein
VSIAVRIANTGTPPVGTATVEIIVRASTPRFPPAQWLINPPIAPGVPPLYLKLVAGALVEMTPAEKTSVDNAIAAELAEKFSADPRIVHFFANPAALPTPVPNPPRGLIAGVGDVGTGRPGLAVTDGAGGFILFDSL